MADLNRKMLPFPSKLKALLSRVRTLLGFSQAEGRDVDVEQAFLRVLVTGLVLGYGVFAGLFGQEFSTELKVALACGLVTGTSGLWMLYRFHRNPERPDWLRSFGIAADLIPITAGLFYAGEIGVPLVGLYLWITVGNGFRFGPRFLLQSYALSAVCFPILLVFAPFWQGHRAVGIGLAILLATIPLYVLVLLSRLTAQKQAAEQLSNAKSRFVANVSHELRTPLTGVVAVHDLLLRRPLAQTDRELVTSLGNAIGALKTSVDAVLQMSKLEAGAEQVVNTLFNLRLFLAQFSARIAPQAESKRLEWTCAIAPDVPGFVIGDSNHLSHVLGNLVNNALKFTASGAVSVRVTSTGSGIRFEVKDTGIGIPEEKQATIFDRFVQADASATRKFGGTGLGTSIAHDLVGLMGGQIGLISASDQGSTFWFELPFSGTDSSPEIVRQSGDIRDTCIVTENLELANQISSELRSSGLNPTLALPAALSANQLSSKTTRAVLLLMSAQSAIELASVHLRSSDAPPWMVILHPSSTDLRLVRLWELGALEVAQTGIAPRLCARYIAAIAASSTPPSTPMQEAAVPRRILIADDNQNNLLLLSKVLEDAGHSVRAVERGGLAYDLMISGQFDIALLDYNMPEMTGPDAVKLFRAGEAGTTERLPILIVSADATPEAQRQTLLAGADGHLTKPVRADELVNSIQKLTRGRPPRVERRAVKRDYPRLVSVNDAMPVVALSVAQPGEKVLVDSARFAELRHIANDDSEFLAKYTNASFSDIDAALRDLQCAVGASDINGVRDALHRIDGTAANLGARALAQTSQKLKGIAVQGNWQMAAQVIAELATVYALTKSAMSAALQQQSPQIHSGASGGS